MTLNQFETSPNLEAYPDDDYYTGLRCHFCNAPTKMVVRNKKDKLRHACKACKEKNNLNVSVIFK